MDLADLKKQLFSEARTHRSFSSKEIEDSKLHEIYDLAKFGPTANNYCPMRVTFVKSPEEKQKLIEAYNVITYYSTIYDLSFVIF